MGSGPGGAFGDALGHPAAFGSQDARIFRFSLSAGCLSRVDLFQLCHLPRGSEFGLFIQPFSGRVSAGMHLGAAFAPGLGMSVDTGMGIFPFFAKNFRKNSPVLEKNICISEKNEYN